MRKAKIIITALILLIGLAFFVKPFNTTIKAQENLDERQLKGVWITPVVGEFSYNNEQHYKNQINEVLEIMEHYGYNALFFHVRTHNNAFYPSEINPTASWFSKVNFEEFDPLAWTIEQTHARGIEFHAWLNPYRVDNSKIVGEYPENNPANDEQNLMTNGNDTILNPALPVVREHIVNTVLELIENYNVDAIHFDDYFYIPGTEHYEPTGDNQRRQQVDLLIEALSDNIKDFNTQNNKAVQFGISPSGIWKNGNGVVTYDQNGIPISSGSDTRGFAHYGSYLFADTIKWSVEGWIDYLVPQMYWARNHSVASYTKIADWWNKMFEHLDVNLYSGIGVYMADAGVSDDWDTNMYEMAGQLALLDTKQNFDGYITYSYKHLRNGYENSELQSGEQIRNAYLDDGRKAIKVLPEIKSMTPVYTTEVTDLNLVGNTLSWTAVEDAKFYYIYASENLTFSNDEIVGVVGPNEGLISYEIEDKTLEYGVKVLSRTNHLSEPSKRIANNVTTNDYNAIRIASLEHTQGLRYYATLTGQYINYDHGFYLIYGSASTEQLQQLINESNNDEIYYNNKEVHKVEVEGLTNENKYSIVLTGIPEYGYTDPITVIAYVENGSEVILSNAAQTTSVLDVSIKLKQAGDEHESIDEIIDYVTLNKKIIYFNDFDEFIISNELYEYNPKKLFVEFSKDLNNYFNTNVSFNEAVVFYNYLVTGLTEPFNANYDLSPSRLYKFFKDPFYQDKWMWVLDFIKSIDITIHGERQVDAIKGDGTNEIKYNGNDYNKLLHYGDHLIYSLYNFFNITDSQGYFPRNTFTAKEDYETLNNFPHNIYINSLNYNFAQVGDVIELPSINGYELAYFDGANNLTSGSEYTVLNNVLFEVQKNIIEYTIEFYDGEKKLNNLTATYTVNDEVSLPFPEKENHVFKGWFEDSNFANEPIEVITKGSFGNKVYYAKFINVENKTGVEYKLNGGTLVYVDREQMVNNLLIDFYNYLNIDAPLSLFIHSDETEIDYEGLWQSQYLDKMFNGPKPEEVDNNYFYSSEEYMTKWEPFFDMMHIFMLEVNPTQPFYEETILDPSHPEYLYAPRVRIVQYVKNEKPANYVSEELMAIMPEPLIYNNLIEIYEGRNIFLPIPYQEGYLFKGWYLEETFTTSALYVTKNNYTTVYAMWEEK